MEDNSEHNHFTDICELVGGTFGVDPSTLTTASGSGNVAGWDSLGHLRLVMAVEKQFKVRFQTDEIGRMKTIDDICRGIARRRA